jgi:hypothetical protein
MHHYPFFLRTRAARKPSWRSHVETSRLARPATSMSGRGLRKRAQCCLAHEATDAQPGALCSFSDALVLNGGYLNAQPDLGIVSMRQSVAPSTKQSQISGTVVLGHRPHVGAPMVDMTAATNVIVTTAASPARTADDSSPHVFRWSQQLLDTLPRYPQLHCDCCIRLPKQAQVDCSVARRLRSVGHGSMPASLSGATPDALATRKRASAFGILPARRQRSSVWAATWATKVAFVRPPIRSIASATAFVFACFRAPATGALVPPGRRDRQPEALNIAVALY